MDIGLYRGIQGLYRDNEKENGIYYCDYMIYGSYRNNGKEHGSYYLGFRGLCFSCAGSLPGASLEEILQHPRKLSDVGVSQN